MISCGQLKVRTVVTTSDNECPSTEVCLWVGGQEKCPHTDGNLITNVNTPCSLMKSLL